MESIDFRYRLSDQGRIVLGPLSSEETLEFEELSRRDREGLIDLTSELRLLELYVKYIGSDARGLARTVGAHVSGKSGERFAGE